MNKPGYSGPRQFQPPEVTEIFVSRVHEAAQQGMRIRYIANSGDGEPTLHPEFAKRMAIFGHLLRKWDQSLMRPEISVVTNGSRLAEPEVLNAVAENGLTLIISLPTIDPDSYGKIMFCNATLGATMIARVRSGIIAAMQLLGSGRLVALHFHISPPDRKIIRRDFPEMIKYLTSIASDAGVNAISLIMFPATSNRSGLIANQTYVTDTYRDLFHHYNGRCHSGVTVKMQLVLKRFFSNFVEIADLVRHFHYPCLWNANFFIAADGTSICCNDQTVRCPQGNILLNSLRELLTAKERRGPVAICDTCNQRPEFMHGSALTFAYSLAARTRINMAKVLTGF